MSFAKSSFVMLWLCVEVPVLSKRDDMGWRLSPRWHEEGSTHKGLEASCVKKMCSRKEGIVHLALSKDGVNHRLDGRHYPVQFCNLECISKYLLRPIARWNHSGEAAVN